MRIFIDHQEYQAEDNETVLQTALRNKLTSIPSLCYHPALPADASCRLCMVEVEGEAGLSAACTLKSREGLAISTKTAAVVNSRRKTLGYLLQRAPDNKLLQKWGEEYGVDISEKMRTLMPGDEVLSNCLLCGLCVRTCRKLGFEALQFTGKGVNRHVQKVTISGITSCIGCQACEKICPTQAIIKNSPAANLNDICEIKEGGKIKDPYES